jgi:nickel/cobalt transporter (NiCoT) family protein
LNFACNWAFAKPVRKVFYNLTITGLSVFVAFFIGTIEILGPHRQRIQPHRRVLGGTGRQVTRLAGTRRARRRAAPPP